MNAISLPPPDPDELAEALLVLRLRLVEAHAIAVSFRRADAPASVRAQMAEVEEVLESALIDNTEPAIATMQQLAQDAESELEAAHIAAERGALIAGSGVRWGRG